MAEYAAVSPQRHASKTWQAFSDYRHFKHERTAPLVAAEFPKACVAFPIAWIANADRFEPVALLGLSPSENLFVDAGHRWLASYVPAHFRSQPFRLIQTEGEILTLGVREDIGLISEDYAGKPFFSEDGEISEALSPIVARLREIEANRAATVRATQALIDAKVFELWSVAPRLNGQPYPLGNLYRIAQEKLNGINAETLAHLRDTGALALAYCQQISQQLITRLETLHERRAQQQVKRSAHPADRVGFGLDDQDSGISFGGMHDEPSDGDPT